MKRLIFIFLIINSFNNAVAEELIHGFQFSKFNFQKSKPRVYPALLVGFNSTLGLSENKLTSFSSEDFSKVYDQLQNSSNLGNFRQKGSALFTAQSFEVSFFPFSELNLGFSSGVGFSSMKTEIVLDDVFLSFRAKDVDGNSYNRRIISEEINNRGGIREHINLSFIDIPLYARYLTPLDPKGKKLFSMDAGVVFRNLKKGMSKAFVTASYEGKYNLDKNGNYREPFSGDVSSSNGWDQTRENTERLFPDNPQRVNERFNTLYSAGYDVGLDHFFYKENSLKFNSSVFWVIRPNFIYNFSKSISVNAGLNVNLGRYNTVKESNYKLLDSRKTDHQEYSSFINGTPKFSGINAGVFVGAHFGFNRVNPKLKTINLKRRF